MKVDVTYEFESPTTEPVSQVDWGRRVTITPRRVRVITSPWLEPGQLWATVEGRVIRVDGTRGSTTRRVSYSDDAKQEGHTFLDAPDWVRDIVAQVRIWESARNATPSQEESP